MSLTMLVVMIIIFIGMALVVDVCYVTYSYMYIKTQMDMSNRAVYKDLDLDKLAERKIYINETAGESTFYNNLKKNLNLDSSYTPTGDCQIRIVGEVKVKSFEIYNEDELPVTSATGTYLDKIAVSSQLEVKIRPIFVWFKDVTIRPYIDTYIPY